MTGMCAAQCSLSGSLPNVKAVARFHENSNGKSQVVQTRISTQQAELQIYVDIKLALKLTLPRFHYMDTDHYKMDAASYQFPSDMTLLSSCSKPFG